MLRILYRKYWQLGFKTRLYDVLSPKAYLDSLQRTAELIESEDNGVLLDAGCGSGLLVQFIEDKLKAGTRYLGTDYLAAGLYSLQAKAGSLSDSVQLFGFQADLTGNFPIKPGSVDSAVAHCSIYTMGDADKRKDALKNIHTALKPGGKLIVVNPCTNYDPKRIIRDSLISLKGKAGAVEIFFRRWFVYPLTLYLGLNYISSQLKKDAWHAYSEEELRSEIQGCGFEVDKTELVYAGSAYLMLCKKV